MRNQWFFHMTSGKLNHSASFYRTLKPCCNLQHSASLLLQSHVRLPPYPCLSLQLSVKLQPGLYFFSFAAAHSSLLLNIAFYFPFPCFILSATFFGGYVSSTSLNKEIDPPLFNYFSCSYTHISVWNSSRSFVSDVCYPGHMPYRDTKFLMVAGS